MFLVHAVHPSGCFEIYLFFSLTPTNRVLSMNDDGQNIGTYVSCLMPQSCNTCDDLLQIHTDQRNAKTYREAKAIMGAPHPEPFAYLR